MPDTSSSYDTYRQIRTDPRIKSLLNKLKTAALNFPINITQPEGCPGNVFNLVQGFDLWPKLYQKLKRVCSGLDYGFSVSKMVWRIEDGLYIPDNIITRKPERFTFGLTYLRTARDFEVSLIPAAEPGYDYEEGQLMNRRDLVAAALRGFDPIWEQDMIADGLIKLAEGNGEGARELYLLNPGALRQRGITLPVELRFNFDDSDPPAVRGLRRLAGMLKKAGVRDTGLDGNPLAPSPLVLNLTFEEPRGTAVYCELSGGGRALLKRDILLPSFSRRDTAAFARELADAVFSGQ
jgi:hypothetical protein